MIATGHKYLKRVRKKIQMMNLSELFSKIIENDIFLGIVLCDHVKSISAQNDAI